MSGALKLFLLSLGVFVAATMAERVFAPDIVPIAWSEEPQKLWAVEAAFLLRATQYIAAGITAVIFVIGLASCIDRKGRMGIRN